jgi:hypothetical protein
LPLSVLDFSDFLLLDGFDIPDDDGFGADGVEGVVTVLSGTYGVIGGDEYPGDGGGSNLIDPRLPRVYLLELRYLWPP